METVCYYLEARTPFHLGVRGVGIEATLVFCHADTLFSALCHTLREVCGPSKLERFLATYPHEPALVLSSAYPYAALSEAFDAGQVLRLYPRPNEPPPAFPDDPKQRKAVKRIAWLSESLWGAWLQGGIPQACCEAKNEPVRLVQGGRVWLTPEEAAQVGERLWALDDAPRVTIDRASSASAVYQVGRVSFMPRGGLWFLVHCRDEWREDIRRALMVLGDAGLGGERSVGHGQFRSHGPCALDSPLAAPSAGGRLVTLSPYYPTEDELAKVIGGDDVSYRLIARRGWMSSPE